MTLALWIVAAAAAVVPLAITAAGLYHLHPHMDTLAHGSSGVAIGATALALGLGDLPAYAAALALALGWEWLEPRLPWQLHTPRQDTEADIAVVTAAAALVVILA